MFRLLYSLLLIVSLFSCSGGSKKGDSSVTGWSINDPSNGGFHAVLDYGEQETGPGLVFVEGGTFIKGMVQDDFMGDWNNIPTRIHIRSFYIDETEVTNLSYKEYLFWLKRVFPPEEQQYKHLYTSALLDDKVWLDRLGYNEAYAENYFKHPAYNNYPVVGVSWLQAKNFCDWRSDRVNEKILIDMGVVKDINGSPDNIVRGQDHFSTETYLLSPESVFKGKEQDAYGQGLPDYKPVKEGEEPKEGEFTGRHVELEDGILLPKYRLPTEVEWEYAAREGNVDREYNNVKGRSKYPWKSKFIVDTKGKNAGEFLANYKRGTGDYSGVSGWSDDGNDITAPVKSYPPNNFGIYDMAGNVSEWVMDVYRAIIDNKESDMNYFRGNEFVKTKLNDEGKPVFIDNNSIDYDTTSSGGLIPKNLPGSVAKVPIKPEDVYMRFNISESYNKDFYDGDISSSKDFETSNRNERKYKMYNSPDLKVEIGSDGNIVPKFDKSNKRTTLVDDKVRVYKGGSWKDRAYWLDPSQRRFMREDLSTNDIGFRCAMDRVGTAIRGSKKPFNN